MTDMFDIAIVGGGPAGAATALALRRRGPGRVLLVEASHFDGPRIGESIPPDTRLLLAELGLWDSFAAEGHDPCHGSCSSWGTEELGYNDFLFNPYGPGWHLDRQRFDAWLAHAAEAAGARVCTGTRLSALQRLAGGGFSLRLSRAGGQEETVEAHLVVDATGRPSRIARQLGASRLLHDRLTFLYGFFPPGTGRRASSLTMLEAVPYGYWYAARLPDGRLVAAVAGDEQIVRDEGLHRLDAWRARLASTRHISGLLDVSPSSEVSLIACEAPSARLDRAAGLGWLAVGDAACAFDPLSSQGIHKSLSDGLRAAAALHASLNGDSHALVAYADAIESRFAEYLRNRAYLYSLEQRWADAPFWVRRRARSSLVEGS